MEERRLSMRLVDAQRCPGDRYPLEDLRDDVLGCDVLDARRRPDDDAVRERGYSKRLHIVRQDVIATGECGAGLGGAVQGEAASRAGAEVYIIVIAGRGDDVDNVALDLPVDVYRAHGCLRRAHAVK